MAELFPLNQSSPALALVDIHLRSTEGQYQHYPSVESSSDLSAGSASTRFLRVHKRRRYQRNGKIRPLEIHARELSPLPSVRLIV